MSVDDATAPLPTVGAGRYTALFASVALVIAGSGFLSTLLGVRAGFEGMTRQSIGLFMSAYFLGYLIGSLAVPRIVYAVGHIRTFAGLTSIASTVSLAHVLFVSAVSWAALRSVHGFCYAGMVLVIESWLNTSTDRSRRGRVLATYGSIGLASLGLGQLLLNVAPVTSFVPFCVASILLSLGLVPVTLTRVSAPELLRAKRMTLGRVLRISPVGAVGVFVAGLSYSAFTGLGPSFAVGLGLDVTGVSLFMGSALLGALITQWPLGILSDMLDRRWVILACTAASLAVCVTLSQTSDIPAPALIGLTTLFGAVSIPAYSICAAHAIDWVGPEDVVPTTSTLLVVFGIGSILGPMFSGLAMNLAGGAGLFLVIGAAQTLFLVYGVGRMRRPRPPEETRERFVALPRTTHVALELDERGLDTPQ